MTLWVCPWCENAEYEDDEEDDEPEEEDIEFEICPDCLFDFQWYFVMEDVELFEFVREQGPDFYADLCEVN